MVITVAVSASYDISVRWAACAPCSGGGIVAALLAPKVLLGTVAATVAASAQAMVFLWQRGGEGSEALAFLGGFVRLAFYTLLVLLPWSLVARLALGRIAGPWAVLALAIAASRLSDDAVTGPLRFAAWALPWLPSAARDPDALDSSVIWLYALAHASAVGSIAAALLRRSR